MPLSSNHINHLADHLFRHESGKMVAVLTKIFGTENLQMAEDVVQETLLHAMEAWLFKGIPDNPSAWLFRVAKNKAIDMLRRHKYALPVHYSDNGKNLFTLTDPRSAIDQIWEEELVEDHMLRMMFACCHPQISEEAQITLILKTLCGFSTTEIAKAFLIPEDTVSKRLYRTKEFFRRQEIKLVIPSVAELKGRTDAVLHSIYLLFNEGYNSTHSEELIRKDLMEEAMMLCGLLIGNNHTQRPETFALMALMCFQASRNNSRLSTEGAIILLPYQDRSHWNYDLIAKGNECMNKAASGNTISAYHLESAIAFEHCTAKSFATTSWERIIMYYEWLSQISPSLFTELNKAVAVMQVHGASAALEVLENISDQNKMQTFYLYHAVLGEIYVQLNNFIEAKKRFETAMELTQSETERKLLKEKMTLANC